MDGATVLKPGKLHQLPSQVQPGFTLHRPPGLPASLPHVRANEASLRATSCDCSHGSQLSCSPSFLPYHALSVGVSLNLRPQRLAFPNSYNSHYSKTPLHAALPTGVEEARTAVDGDNVRVDYTGKLEDGSVFDSSVGKSPISFRLGSGQLVPGFEAAVRGMRVGEKKTATLPPDQAYGPIRPDMVMTVPADKAPQGLTVGQKIGLGTQTGQKIPATVTEITPDGSVTVDANHMLAGKTLIFDLELVGFRELLAPSEAPAGLELATFAAGCFWGVELAFQRVPGVISSNVGYCQGQKEQPTYEEVCSAQTGHTEGVRVVFDPQKVSFSDLLKVFWERVGKNAVTLNVAGNDTGPQYRSGIYFHSKAQEEEARQSLEKLQEELGQTVVTEIEAAAPFWLAEDYHQQYLEKGGQSAAKECTDTIRCYG
eukprot:gnl/MRDRNA2_/MRDRNA2_33769_c0_seq2.p1 gnl/MRDRNA2_/MRDRNA2_33769_c0~~gnl/MRDRNA2_/MRDRNA2_33769_c0_seq2.p1  ORF type:complete len:426 (+),score=66.06 gnl/MRDRNA2_/MRDRNA2_33769_c0_seq2:41-1318(+)